jgi:hypothetical protein
MLWLVGGSNMKESEFVPIKITGCDEQKVRRSSGRKGMYVIPFSLSAKAPRPWQDKFEDIWGLRRKLASKPKPQAYFRKNELRIECPLGDLHLHFPNLRADVDTANQKFTEDLRIKAEKDSKKKLKREEEKVTEKSAIHEAVQGLDFS